MKTKSQINTTVLQLIEQKMESLTAAQRKVADYILKHHTEVAFATVEQLSGIIGVSVASVMRLSYSLGYTGYTQFQKDLQEMLRSRVAPAVRMEANVTKIGKRKLLIDCAENQINNIKNTVEYLSDKEIDEAINLISTARKVYVLGVRWSLPVVHLLDQGLTRLGIDCEMLVPDTSRLYAVIAKMTSDDLVITVSVPRYSKRTLEITQAAKSKGAKILSITDGYSSPLALESDVFLKFAFDSLSFLHSSAGALFVADFLLTSISVKNPKLTKKWLEDVEKVISSFDANLIK